MMSADIISIGSREHIKAAPGAVSNVEHTHKAGGTRHTSPPPMTVVEFAMNYELLPLEEQEAIRAQIASALLQQQKKRVDTASNQHLRNQRRAIWERVEAAREYWSARYELDMAIRCSQNKGVSEGGLHPAWKVEDHKMLYAKRDEETTKQLLTPGYDLVSIEWKRRRLARWPEHYTTDQKKRIEKLIAADLAFLTAHPIRRDPGSKQ